MHQAIRTLHCILRLGRLLRAAMQALLPILQDMSHSLQLLPPWSCADPSAGLPQTNNGRRRDAWDWQAGHDMVTLAGHHQLRPM